MSTISLYPHVSLIVILILSMISILISLTGFIYRTKGSIFRTLTLIIIIFSLMNPKIIAENKIDIPDIVALIIDLSPSQNINDRHLLAQKASKLIEERLNKNKNIEVRSKTIDEKNSTKIFGELSKLTGDIPRNRIAGAIIITDGQIHDIPKDLKNYNFNAPIHFLITGNKNTKDRRLIVEDAPRYGIVGEEVSVNIKIEDDSATNPNALVSVNINDGEVKTKSIAIGEKVKLTLPLDKPGITNLNISVEEGSEELTLKNNSSQLTINAIRDRLRVMLISGEPNMGLRSWRNLLNSDPSVDLMHFTILRPPQKQDLTPVGELSLIPFPARELFQLNLNEFDLIIFDQYHLRGILPTNYLKNVVEYVVKGGALLDTTGPKYAGKYSLAFSPLQNILPTEPTGQVINEEFIPQPTDEGIRHPVIAELNNLEDFKDGWGPWYRIVESVALSGDVLLEDTQKRPLLVLNRLGKGRVAQILSDQSWVWTKSLDGEGPQAEMLRRLIHWLMKEPELEENNLNAAVKDNRIFITRNSLINDNSPIEVISPSGSLSSIDLKDLGNGKQTGTIHAKEEGVWQLSYNNNLINITVGNENSLEFEDVRATDSKIKNISNLTKGKIIWLKDDLEESIPKIKFINKNKINNISGNMLLAKNDQFFIKGIEQISLIHWSILLTLIIFSLFIAWYRESK